MTTETTRPDNADHWVTTLCIGSVLCGVCYMIGVDHATSNYESEIKLLKARISQQKLILDQPCLREGKLKQIIYQARRSKPSPATFR